MAEVSFVKLPSGELTLDLTDKSTLVQVMAWSIRQQAIIWTNVEQVLCRHVASLGHNELTHWAGVTYICLKNLTILGSDNVREDNDSNV